MLGLSSRPLCCTGSHVVPRVHVPGRDVARKGAGSGIRGEGGSRLAQRRPPRGAVPRCRLPLRRLCSWPFSAKVRTARVGPLPPMSARQIPEIQVRCAVFCLCLGTRPCCHDVPAAKRVGGCTISCADDDGSHVHDGGYRGTGGVAPSAAAPAAAPYSSPSCSSSTHTRTCRATAPAPPRAQAQAKPQAQAARTAAAERCCQRGDSCSEHCSDGVVEPWGSASACCSRGRGGSTTASRDATRFATLRSPQILVDAQWQH